MLLQKSGYKNCFSLVLNIKTSFTDSSTWTGIYTTQSVWGKLYQDCNKNEEYKKKHVCIKLEMKL